MSYLRFLLFVIVALSYLIPSIGQDGTLVFHKLDQSKGLAAELNAHFGLDTKGFFWTSSRQGLNRFDGKEVKVYRPTYKGTALQPNITSQVFEDKDLNKWFTSSSALHCLIAHTDSIRSWQFFEPQNAYYYALHLEQDSILWMVANQQLYTINILNEQLNTNHLGAFNTYNATAITDDTGRVVSLFRPNIKEGNGFELIKIEHGPKLSDADTFFSPTTQAQYPSTRINFLQIENDSSYWIPSYEGLIHFNPNRPDNYKIFRHQTSSSSEQMLYIDAALWKDQYLWVTTRGEGLLVFDIINKSFIRQDSIFYQYGEKKTINNFFRVQIDKYGTLWLSIVGEGILFSNLPNNKFDYIPSQHSNQEIYAITELNDGNLLFSSFGELLQASYPQPKISINRTKQTFPKPNEKVYRLLRDKEQSIWMLSSNNLWQWRPQTNNLNLRLTGLSRIFDIVQVSDSCFWFFDDSNIYELASKQPITSLSKLKKIDTTLNLPAQLLYDDISGLAFISQSDNILKIYNKSSRGIEVSNLEGLGVVNDLSVQNSDSLWLASSTGLFLLNPKSLSYTKVTHHSDLLDRSFLGIEVDHRGKIWLSSYWGIFNYDPYNNEIHHFTQSDGLISMRYRKNTSLKGQDGKIYFGGDKGITVINPYQVQLNTTVPSIQLMAVSVNNETKDHRSFLSTNEIVNLSYNENSLDFKFAVVDFSDPNLTDFNFTLLKNEKDTILQGNSNPIELKFLSPGKYTILSRAANSDGFWTNASEPITFKIRPPWYATWWARTTGVALLMLTIYAIYRNRIKNIQLQEEAKRKQAELKQLAAETETAVLRLQMNPHFIFNSMNSINSYILKRDVDRASDYLQRFSKLMRLILERSQQEFTDLEEEMELLTYYLETEVMRLKKPLTYQFKISDDIEPDDVLLPTMILQPFIENAIWHGISPKKEGGNINIRFSIKDKQLLSEVEDNGVGRSYHNLLENSTHNSKALTITQRRLELLSEKKRDPAKFIIKDLWDKKGQPKGTLVQLYLPLID